MADTLEGLLFHPLTVIAHILRQPLGPAPDVFHVADLGLRVHRSHARKPGRNLNHGLVDHNGHRVQIVGMGLQSQALGLQRNGSAAGKGVQQLRRISVGRLQNLRPGRLQYPLVVGILPDHQILQNAEQPLSLPILFFLCRELLRVGGGIVHQAGPNHSSGRRQWPPCPPEMQGGRVPVADGFLPGGLRIDFFQGQRHLDQFLCCHITYSPLSLHIKPALTKNQTRIKPAKFRKVLYTG